MTAYSKAHCGVYIIAQDDENFWGEIRAAGINLITGNSLF
jgi:hypothetical protein